MMKFTLQWMLSEANTQALLRSLVLRVRNVIIVHVSPLTKYLRLLLEQRRDMKKKKNKKHYCDGQGAYGASSVAW